MVAYMLSKPVETDFLYKINLKLSRYSNGRVGRNFGMKFRFITARST